MKPARESNGRPGAAADAADTVAAADMAVAAKVASEEATDEFANHGFGRAWAGLDSNQRRRKASRFTVCPVWPLRYLPFAVSGILVAASLRMRALIVDVC